MRLLADNKNTSSTLDFGAAGIRQGFPKLLDALLDVEGGDLLGIGGQEGDGLHNEMSRFGIFTGIFAKGEAGIGDWGGGGLDEEFLFFGADSELEGVDLAWDGRLSGGASQVGLGQATWPVL